LLSVTKSHNRSGAWPATCIIEFQRQKRDSKITMIYKLLADFVFLAHLSFVLFVVLGGLAVWRWPKLAWLHLPAMAWGALISFTGWICPLTPWEQSLRRLAGEAGYSDGFVENYLLHLLYPEGLTRDVQIVLGVLVLVINAAAYAFIMARRQRGSEINPGSE